MPPQKKLRRDELQELVDVHNIVFEGTVPSSDWPAQYERLFRVIKDISNIRYEEYVERTDLDMSIISLQESRVASLQGQASNFRRDISINEASWRNIERLVFERLTIEAAWFVYQRPLNIHPNFKTLSGRCRGEKWQSEYQPLPLEEAERDAILGKRVKRHACICHTIPGSDRHRRYVECF